jgi:hypothetical protein
MAAPMHLCTAGQHRGTPDSSLIQTKAEGEGYIFTSGEEDVLGVLGTQEIEVVVI